MKDFKREDLSFSLCGLNCRLCPMFLYHYCPGCGGGEGNQACGAARCSLQHGKVEYCHLCGEFPCERYDRIDEYDSFITHRNRRKDMELFQKMGAEAYHSEQAQKAEILSFLLENYNDGRRKSLFCLAVNLLELEDIKDVMRRLAEAEGADVRNLKQKAAQAAELFQDMAEQRNLVLKLNKKPKGK
ncbi:DUF3795 domain-containing protein [Lacrimispora sp. NSJ-141]|uniref:DUF3795 domain-containing protein n=1 Tax=Lientehia hominis TaxID=2897778 RepID=A0AAP2RLW9_9FIRM|nr:DUF3795 domain-containing protein [Lientehia hominis]MCD2493628.1 DUF3795 domain-containing protein [Lientehia hominis]